MYHARVVYKILLYHAKQNALALKYVIVWYLISSIASYL
jgi:hypothetical protein